MLSEPNPDLLHPVQSDEFLPPVSRWTTFGGLFLVGAVGVAITMAAVIPYNVTVKATAVVRPLGELRLVQAATAGSVKSITVKENQVVNQGDAIASIDDSQLQTQKRQLEGNIQNNQQQIAQISAQISALDKQRNFEISLINRTIAAAEADLSLNQRDYQDKQIITSTEVQEAQAALELAKEELKRYQQLGNTGAIASLQIKEKEQAFKAAQARVERTKAALNPSNASVSIANERIAQERARGSATLATLDKERQELLQRRIEIQNQLNRDRKDLQQIGVELAKTVIRAPATGTILKLNLRNTSQVVNAGDAIAQISPSNTSMVVMARVAAPDVAKVKVCNQQIPNCQEGRVQLRFSAYPYPDYGTLKGAVRAISPDATTPENNANANVAPFYAVTIQPERAYFIRGERTYPILPGMDVTADIISRQETVMTFLLRKARLLTDL